MRRAGKILRQVAAGLIARAGVVTPRIGKIVKRLAVVLIGVPLLLAGAILVAANTGPGQRLMETMAGRVTSGMVRIEGLSGRFPDDLHVHRLLVADDTGVWLTVDDASLVWSPLRLPGREVSIDQLTAESVLVARLPVSKGGGSTQIPAIRLTVSHARVGRLELGTAVAGQPMALRVEGSGVVSDPASGEAHLTAVALAPSDGGADRPPVVGPSTGQATGPSPASPPPARIAPAGPSPTDSSPTDSSSTGPSPNGPSPIGPTPAGASPTGRPPVAQYQADVAIDRSQMHATLKITEASNGIVAGVAGLPDIGAIRIAAVADGPLDALTVKVGVEAGELRGSVDGTVDAANRAGNLTFSASAPRMSPASDIHWASIRLTGSVRGPFTSPEAAGDLAVDDMTAAGAGFSSLRAKISGNGTGTAELHAQLDGLRVPGPSPDVLATGPMTLDATAQLSDPSLATRFMLRHGLFSAEGTANTTNTNFRLTVPDLAPLAAISGADLKGNAVLDIGASRSGDGYDLTVKGGIGIAGGIEPATVLVGNSGTIDLAVGFHGEQIALSRMTLQGSAASATAHGGFVDRKLDLDWTMAFPDLGVLRPGATGDISVRGHAGGSPDGLSVTADLTGDVASDGGRIEQFTAHLDLDGLPDAPAGRLTAGGTVLGAPLSVEISARRPGGGVHVVIDRLAWKSLSAGGALDLAAGETLPAGKVWLSMTRLADLSTLAGRPVTGRLTAEVDASPEANRINATLVAGGVPGTLSVGKAVLEATVTGGRTSVDTGAIGKLSVDGTLALDPVDAGGVRGSARLTAKGPVESVALSLAATIPAVQGKPARVDASGTLNAAARALMLASMQADWGRETLRLLAPARIAFLQGVMVDRLRLGFRQGELALAGGLSTAGNNTGRLDVKATLTNLPADVAALFAPDYAADGTISGDARLTGNPAQPEGTVHVNASKVRLRSSTGRALPPAEIAVNAVLNGPRARVDGKVTAGTSSLTATGTVPLSLAGAMDLRVTGIGDLAMVNPWLAAQGRIVRGRIDVALAAGGAVSSPKISGTAQVSGGDFQDAGNGVHLSAIAASVRSDGETVRIDRFVGTAGQGTVTVAGSVGLTGNRLVDLNVRASNARLLANDLATALTDATLTLRGPVTGTPILAGTLVVRKADIQVPEKLPPSIAVLPVRDARAPRQKPRPEAPAPDIALDLTVDAPSQIYIRGRGIDAELGGRVKFTGTASQPVPHGGLRLRRGAFSLAGQSLNFTEGTIDFAGGALTNPPLKLIAKVVSAALTSTLTISGDVRNPKILLSSIPDMPQDEILSQLLFNSVRAKLGPFQLAQIASALATLSGVGSPVGDPLAGIRSRLGLDQLSVGSNARGGATLEAGRYLAPGVRVGAKQGLTGGETQATVQIDIAKGLKLETTAGTGATSATGSGGGSNAASVGVTYQFEY